MNPSPPRARDRGPDCLRCQAYYVTHDAARPHGCRAFGFRSQRLPRDEVRLSSGAPCALFEPKPSRPEERRAH